MVIPEWQQVSKLANPLCLATHTDSFFAPAYCICYCTLVVSSYSDLQVCPVLLLACILVSINISGNKWPTEWDLTCESICSGGR